MKKDIWQVKKEIFKETKNSRPNFGELTSYFLVM